MHNNVNFAGNFRVSGPGVVGEGESPGTIEHWGESEPWFCFTFVKMRNRVKNSQNSHFVTEFGLETSHDSFFLRDMNKSICFFWFYVNECECVFLV